MYKVLDVAWYIIYWCHEQNKAISNLKLQKLLYFVQAEFLIKKGVSCFFEEIEAWSFGPVVPEVYQRFKVYGSGNIPIIGRRLRNINILEEDKKIIDRIISQGVKYSASELVYITHNQLPWKEAYSKPGHNNIISKKSIKSYFEEE